MAVPSPWWPMLIHTRTLNENTADWELQRLWPSRHLNRKILSIGVHVAAWLYGMKSWHAFRRTNFEWMFKSMAWMLSQVEMVLMRILLRQRTCYRASCRQVLIGRTHFRGQCPLWLRDGAIILMVSGKSLWFQLIWFAISWTEVTTRHKTQWRTTFYSAILLERWPPNSKLLNLFEMAIYFKS